MNAPPAAPSNGGQSFVAVGLAVGGNISGSTINFGIPPEQLDGLIGPHRELSEMLKAKLDQYQRQVRAALEIFGEANVPPERQAAKLVEIAERHAKVAGRKAEAEKAIEAGDLAKADALVADIAEEIRKVEQRFNAYGGVLLPPGFSIDILGKGAAEIDKLRKENKDLKATTLIVRNTLLFLKNFSGGVNQLSWLQRGYILHTVFNIGIHVIFLLLASGFVARVEVIAGLLKCPLAPRFS